jgi:fibronectin-binding autotransporter adhesin
VTNLAQGARTFNINFNGATLIAAASQTAFLPTATSAKVQAGNAIIDDGGNAITIGAALGADGASPGGGLIKRGVGTLTLTGNNTYTGSTIITNGTLALSGGVSIASSANIALAAGTVFDVSGLGTFIIAANQILSGHGTVIGNMTDVANAKISPGGPGGVGTLNFANDLTLAGGDTLDFDFSTGGSNDLITVAGTVTPNGVTTINLANWPLTNGFPVGTYVLLQATNSLAGSTNNFVLAHQPGRQTMSLLYDTSASPNQLLLVVPTPPGNIGNLVWQGGQNANAWDVQTTSNWLNGVSGDVFYQSDTVLFSNVPPANTSVNLAQDVAPGTVIFQGTNDYVISGSYKITGAASLTQNGSGTVTLNTVNDYSGGTTINSGALRLGDGVSYAGAVAGDITNNASLVLANPYDLEFSTTVIGPGQLVKTGPNTLTLTTAQPYTGGTVISAGTLQLGNGGATGALSPSGVINNSGILSLNRSGTTSQGTNFGVITGTGSVQHLTSGLVNLTASNSHSGGTTLFGSGRIQVSDSRAFGFGKVYLKSTQSSFFATLSLTGGLTVTNDIEIDSTTGRENIETLSGTNTLSGDISITGAGANTIIVQNNSTQPFYLGGDITGADFTGSVSFRGNMPNNTIMSSAQINLPNGRIDFSPNAPNNDWTIESVGNRWTKVTMGGSSVAKVTLAANNGLATNAPVAWATGSAITLNLNGQNQTVAGLDLASTTSTPTISNGSTNSDSILTLAGLALDYTYAGVITDGAARKVSLVMNSAGRTQTLSGTNAYTGNTTVTAGTLVIQQPTLASNSTVSVAGTALLQLDFAGAETNQVAALMLNGANQLPGIYSSNTHPAYLAGAGSLLVVPTMASYPTNITASVSGGTLTLTWPETHLGWYAQSNSVSLADTNFWFDVANSQLDTNLIITVNPAQTNVFYRLRHP